MRRREWLHAALCLPWLAAEIVSIRTATATNDSSPLFRLFGEQPTPERIRRVFAAGPAAGILVYALAADKLLNWPLPLTAEQRRYLTVPARELPFQRRPAGQDGDSLFEALLPQQPDLIIDVDIASASYLSSVRGASASTGIPYLLLRGRMPDYPGQLRAAGRFLAVAERAEALAVHTETLLARAEATHAGLTKAERPGVYYAYGADGLETGVRGSAHAEVIEIAGGRNVAVSEVADDRSMLRTSVAQILAWDPRYIVASDAAFVHRTRYDPEWQNVPAVRAGNVHLIPDRPFNWFGTPAGINRLAGINWLLALLYPERFSPETDLPAATETFYRLFYGVELSRADYQKLLSSQQ